MSQETIQEEVEQKNRRVAAVSTIVIDVAIVALLLFGIAIRPEYPPLPSQGIELNFGTDNEGSGDIQTRNIASASKKKIASASPNGKSVEEKYTTPKPEKPAASKPMHKAEVMPTKEKAVSAKEVPIRTSSNESPVKMSEVKPQKTKVLPKNTTPTPVKEKPAQPEKIETPPLVAKPNPNSVYKKSTGSTSNGSGGNGTVGNTTEKGGNNNGDDKSGVGDKGNPQGKLDAKGQYGKPGNGGGGNGVSVNVSGFKPVGYKIDRDNSDDTGKIVFEITLDEDGGIINIRTREATVGPSLIDFYRRQIQRINFEPTSGGTRPPRTTGTITILITSK